ncbi:MAG: ribonuclease HII [bacterium]|nr:ribonuclease HII [bacterium]
MKNAWIVGIDEAGRGPLAGPVTLAYVACPSRVYRRNFKNIRDSKKLTLKKREEWFSHITDHPYLEFGVTSVGQGIIDRRGISRAVKIGIRRLLSRMQVRPKMILLDGSLYAPPEYSQKTIIKGDEKIPIIAAASVIAKVTRDRKMVRLAKKFPKYGFHIHKGYGTKLHCKLVKKYGLCDIHRRSFCTKFV